MDKRYRGAAHRLKPPEETLSCIEPHFSGFGFTRCADLTGLDRLGIPVCCTFNPANPVLQVSWGKGAKIVDAKVSAAMEAIERYHVCFPDARVKKASQAELENQGHDFISPFRLQRFNETMDFSDSMDICWLPMEAVTAEKLPDQVYVPAAAVYPCEPQVNYFSANGLASGNCTEEAQLHALYEIIERNGISCCFDQTGRLTLKQNKIPRMDMNLCPQGPVRELYEKICRADLELVLLRPDSRVEGVYLFWAALIEEQSPVLWTRINLGYGAHASPTVAAVRAITEAAQSRLAFLHGCREDMGHKMLFPQVNAVNKTVRYFSSFVPETPWDALDDYSHDSLDKDLSCLTKAIFSAGFSRICRLQIPCEVMEISILKMIVEGMNLRHGLF